MKQLFDKTDKMSIFQYSQGLLGHTLREFADNSEIMQLSGRIRASWLNIYILNIHQIIILKQISQKLEWN